MSCVDCGCHEASLRFLSYPVICMLVLLLCSFLYTIDITCCAICVQICEDGRFLGEVNCSCVDLATLFTPCRHCEEVMDRCINSIMWHDVNLEVQGDTNYVMSYFSIHGF